MHLTLNSRPQLLLILCLYVAMVQGIEIHQNVSAGIIVSNQTLVLQKLSRTQAGHYTCVGSNTEGDGESAPLNLRVRCK